MRRFKLTVAILVILLFVERGHSTVFMQKGTAIAKVLGTKKVFQGPTVTLKRKNRFLLGQKKKGKWKIQTFYSKNKKGKPKRFAVSVNKLIYPPNCDHEWMIGVNAKTFKVTEVAFLAATCPHAFPARKAGFLDQFKGKGPKEARGLASSIATEATATGSCELTADAVEMAISAAKKARKGL